MGATLSKGSFDFDVTMATMTLSLRRFAAHSSAERAPGTKRSRTVVRGVVRGTHGRKRWTIVAKADGEPASVSASCSIDDPASCSLADLELMYVDALWNDYHGGKFTLTDEQYDRLREELNWQGSGFPTLRRYEIEFVQAAISYSRGEAVVDDAKYEELKRKVKAAGKRTDVTALLLYAKGKELLDEAEFELLSGEMKKLGIDVGMRGATCTLSQTSTELSNDPASVASMYSALAIAPFAVGLAPSILLGFVGVHLPASLSLGFALTVCAALTYKVVVYTNLQNAEILLGACPCCEMPIKQFFGGEAPLEKFEHKCSACGTVCTLNRPQRLIETAGGLGRA